MNSWIARAVFTILNITGIIAFVDYIRADAEGTGILLILLIILGIIANAYYIWLKDTRI